jgi:hypothetical protein
MCGQACPCGAHQGSLSTAGWLLDLKHLAELSKDGWHLMQIINKYQGDLFFNEKTASHLTAARCALTLNAAFPPAQLPAVAL